MPRWTTPTGLGGWLTLLLGLLISLIGAILVFGGAQLASWLGRRRSYFLISLGAVTLTMAMFQLTAPLQPGFHAIVFAQGLVSTLFFGWLALYLPELFPTHVRATGSGLAYNSGRFATAAGVLLAGFLFTALGGDYARVGTLCATIYALGLVVRVPGRVDARDGHSRVDGHLDQRRRLGDPVGDEGGALVCLAECVGNGHERVSSRASDLRGCHPVALDGESGFLFGFLQRLFLQGLGLLDARDMGILRCLPDAGDRRLLKMVEDRHQEPGLSSCADVSGDSFGKGCGLFLSERRLIVKLPFSSEAELFRFRSISSARAFA
jgi:MFS family permease